ncbi:hypothetical protein [Limoniibacter endophyticus]|uniref:hypothetical protein n=1 Tax=Limoniibacter endophyticus TaxID=1565040 RepID=UPI0016726B83|nr:hypothetical protein [Limoniibacter endophyticus]
MPNPQAERHKRLAYIAEMLAQLRLMALQDGHDLVAHLISMAQMEARTNVLTAKDHDDPSSRS